MTKKQHIIQLLETGTPPHQVAATVGCSKSYVHAINRNVFGHRNFTKSHANSIARPPAHTTGRRCTRCTFAEELPLNPIDATNVCLYCRLQAAGVNLLDYHESGAWQQQTARQGDTP